MRRVLPRTCARSMPPTSRKKQGHVEEDINILIADRIAQEGIDLLRTQLPEANIDVDYGLRPQQLKGIISKYTRIDCSQ